MRQLQHFLASAALVAIAAPALAQSGPLVSGDTEPQGAGAPVRPAEADQGNADNASARQAAEDEGGLADIVVTAQKREQRLQDVPVAVTALTAEMLLNRGINDVAAVTRAVPSLTLTQTNNPTNNSINIRGIGTAAFSTGVEPAVAVILDDVALLQQAQAFSGLTDIARLEVLRGPQGTLFGKGASAGVVNIASQAPGSTLTASFGAQWTTDDERRIDGSVGGPVTDWLGVRANGFFVDREGYVRNLATGTKQGGEESVGMRIRTDIDPTPGLNISLSGSYSRNKVDPVRTFREITSPNVRIFAVPPFFAGNLLVPGLLGVTPGPQNYAARQNIEGMNDSRQQLYIGRATLDLGFADLISVTGYQDWRLSTVEDVDGTDLASVGNNPRGVYQNSAFHARQFSQELRLVSAGAGPLTYVLGLYYADGKTDREFRRFAFGPGAQQWTSQAGTRSYAAFAQATYNITPTTHVDAGLRFNREKISVSFTDLRTAATPASCGITCTGGARDDQVTYKVALRQDLTPDVMVYGSYATGYKGQGYDVSSGFTASRAAIPVRPEHSKAYELGLKGKFFNNKVQMNLAGFWTDYEDFQTQVANFVGGVPTFNLANAPSLRSKGVEVDLTARPFRALRIDAAASYTDARIREFSGGSCYPAQPFVVGISPTTPGVCVGTTPATGTQNLAGARLANAPKFKYSISANYDIELPTMPFNGFVQADWAYQSAVNFDIAGNPLARQKAYGLLNASVGVESSEDAGYRVSLFVNNLLDQSYATAITPASGTTTDAGVGNVNTALVQFLPRDSRRYFGVRGRLRY